MRNRLRLFAVMASLIAGLVTLNACGGGSSGGTKPVNGALVILPGSASVPVGQSVQFTAFLGDTATSSTWTASAGTIDSSGNFTAPSSPTSVTITAVAGSNGGTSTVSVVAAQPITVTPSVPLIPAGGLQTFTSSTPGVSWTVNGGVGNCLTPAPNATTPCYGVIDGSGNYQAPLSPPTGGTVTITASSGADSGTAAATILFSSASLTGNGSSGQYVVSLAGIDFTNGYPLNVVGSILTSGNATSNSGSIVGGEIDINSLTYGLFSGGTITGGSYQVGPVDGRTTLTFTNSSSSSGIPSFTLQVTLQNNQHALLIDFDNFATGSGTLDLQNPAQFATLNGNFAFSVSGVDTTLFNNSGYILPVYAAGAFVANGNSIPVNPVNAPVNVQDVVENALTTPLVTNDQSLNGSYTNVDGSGRGTVTMSSTPLGTVNYAYYVIDQTHLKVVEIDPSQNLALYGDIYSAPTTPTPLTGGVSFTAGGATSNLNAYVMGGVFSVSGTGISGTGIVDINAGTQIQNGNAIQSGSLTNSSGTGIVPSRYLLSLSTKSPSAQLTFSVYNTATNPPSAVMIETDNFTAGGTGMAYQQTSGGAVAGSFAFNMTGVGNSRLIKSFEQDLTGQVVLTANSTTVNGTIDLNNAGTSTSTIVPASSMWNAAATNGRGVALVKTSDGAVFNVPYYLVSGNTALLLDIDSNRIAAGILTKQF